MFRWGNNNNNASRLPPPSGPPPGYATAIKKVYPYSLRPIVIFTAGIGFIWSIIMGVEDIKDRSYPNESSKQQLFDLITAIIYFTIALVEITLIVIAIMQNVSLAKAVWIIAPLGLLLTLTVQMINVITHWTLKSDQINQCVLNSSGNGFTTQQNTNGCNNSWDRGTWTVIVWLLISLILAGLFASVALSYYRQLLDPNSVRQRNRVQTDAYAMSNQAPYSYPQYPQQPPQQQSWMVPPYPGPPANMPPKGFEKGDYQPEAEWANYPPPPGSPGVSRDPFEDRSRNEGSSGHVIPNREEDEAWERARNEGVTAHLTGNVSNAPRKDGVV